ncbi:type II secretion system protein [Nitrosospira sp. NpAV]|uniref:type II secretion system protein n=1 Tax=Nitrosospira sp. NpAV TaxID=58133 RepID=UPI0005A01C97|nr:type II secretion system protein [Nitrosospira sp. NpAV]KIO50476.1 secretion system X pseudopilin PulG-like protein [Nitrosospira sp. NpAV]
MGAERGFTYIWILFAVAVAGIVLAAAGQLWQTEAQREKEVELMFVGEQFRQAIGSYYESSPGMPKRYPDSQERLLFDDRFPIPKRHLRKIYFDPMTGRAEWGLIRKPGIGIVGIHSLSTRKPVKRANFHERYAKFADAVSYEDWTFVYTPGETGGTAQQPGSQPQSQSKSRPESQSQPKPQPQPKSPAQPDAPPDAPPPPASSDPSAAAGGSIPPSPAY